MDYRAEIDGLRAVAVLPVILFHAGFESFNGGFVGVDVFFVISGYLITTIILTEMEQGTFSLVNFYERRARRILPALFTVMFVSLPFAWMWLLPADMKDFSQSLVAVATFASNILFWWEAGYWDQINELKPLLHTWSLAVEEQFYIFFPLLLLLVWRLRKRWIVIFFVTMAAISLLLAQWGAINMPSANFLLLPTRGWELAIGAGTACYFVYRRQTNPTIIFNKIIAEMLGVLGLLLIGYAIFTFDRTIAFPGFYALIPTIGTALIIVFSSSGSLIGRLLGTKVLVGIGLISYSAYLWHQPLFAFARHRSLSRLSEFFFLALVLISFAIAYLSWKYIEMPFRKKNGVSRRAIFSFAAAGSVFFISIGLAANMVDRFGGISSINGLSQKAIEEKSKPNYGLSATCQNSFTLLPDCRTSDEPEILVWGDSFAMHLVRGILSSNPDAKIIQMTKSFCGPFFDIAPVSLPMYPTSWAEGCLEFTRKVRKWIKVNNTVKYAVVSSFFSQYLSNDRNLLLRSGEIVKPDIDIAAREFKNTLSELKAKGITPIVFSPPPANGMDLGRCLARAERFGLRLDKCNFRVDEIIQDRMEAYRFLEAIDKHYNVIQLKDIVCNSSECNTHYESAFLYRDESHFSNEGSYVLGKKSNFYGMIVDGHSYAHPESVPSQESLKDVEFIGSWEAFDY